MRKRPKHYGTYYAYAMREFNNEKLPKQELKKIFMDVSNTFCGIALYREKLSADQVKENALVYLGVYCDE